MTDQTIRTILQIVLINDTGDSYYRMRWPGMNLAAQAPHWRIINIDAKAQERFEWGELADLLVVYQSHDQDLLPLIKRRKALGKKTLVEYNDNFYAPPPASPVNREWSSPLLWQAYETFMRESDGVIVTGPGLQELLGAKTGRDIFILENHLPADPPLFESLWSEPRETLNIGWAGSLGHMSDFLALAPVFEELIKLDQRIVLHFMGNKAIPEVLALPPGRMRFTNWGSMDQYFKFWEPIHIGIAPLIETPYNNCRSDIKAVEMSSRGVLPLLRDALPYRQFLEKTGLTGFNTLAELTAQILRYLNSPEDLRTDTERCYAHVKAHRVGPRRTERLELYARCLPDPGASREFPMPPGYYEVLGTPQGKSKQQIILSAIQEHVRANQRAQALGLSHTAWTENPNSAELAHMQLKCLALVDNIRVAPLLEQRLQQFPDDLRFWMLKLNYLTSLGEKQALWQAVFAKLKQASPSYRAFFESEVVNTLCAQCGSYPDFAGLGEALLEIYPDSCELRFTLATTFERRGESEKAHSHFSYILDMRLKFAENQRFLSSIENGFLQTWIEALRVRKTGSFR